MGHLKRTVLGLSAAVSPISLPLSPSSSHRRPLGDVVEASADTSHRLQARTTQAVSEASACLSSVAWSDSRVDLFGVAPDASLWHKFYTGHDWQPFGGFERLPAAAAGCPAVSSWGPGRLDAFYVNASGANVLHKYYGGGTWGPSSADSDPSSAGSADGATDLGGDARGALAAASWAENRLDVVARGENGSYAHKAWTGDAWFPQDARWEDLGGRFFSDPAVVAWGEGRLDIVGLDADNASLHHLYWDGHRWSGWADLGGGPFVGNPVATSWGAGRLDFWAIDADGALHHLYWDGHRWSAWENLGGEFTDTPRVVHWQPGRIDIVGKSLADETFQLKNYDGARWNPSVSGWWDLAGPFSSEPALLAKKETSEFHFSSSSSRPLFY